MCWVPGKCPGKEENAILQMDEWTQGGKGLNGAEKTRIACPPPKSQEMKLTCGSLVSGPGSCPASSPGSCSGLLMPMAPGVDSCVDLSPLGLGPAGLWGEEWVTWRSGLMRSSERASGEVWGPGAVLAEAGDTGPALQGLQAGGNPIFHSCWRWPRALQEASWRRWQVSWA